MEQETKQLLSAAEFAKHQFKSGDITYDEMRAECKKYIDHANTKAVAIAKRFGMRPKKISLLGFMR